jgi:hypothetical protein
MEDFAPPAATETVSSQQDYFGFSTTTRHMLPDKVSYVELKVLTEGERRAYQNASNRDVKFDRGGSAQMKLRPGDDRANLLKVAIVGWNLMRQGQPVPFTPQSLDLFLNNTDPKVVDGIEKAIRKSNPWLLSEMSSDDIKKEIEDLTELLAVKLEEEAGNDTSDSK